MKMRLPGFASLKGTLSPPLIVDDRSYIRAAECHKQLKCTHDAACALANAATCYRRVDPDSFIPLPRLLRPLVLILVSFRGVPGHG